MRVLLLIGAMAVAGCGPRVDNPANPPQLGKWQRETKLAALVVNDVWVPRDRAPFALPDDSTETKNCFEPMIKSKDEINRDMANGAAKICKLDALEMKDGQLDSTGTCAPKEVAGGELSGTLEVHGSEAAEKAEATFSANLIYRERTGAAQRVRAAFRTSWARLGPCGS